MSDIEEVGERAGWFLAGAVVGATLALLFAPTSGKQTRRVITRSTKDGREAVEASGRELMDRGKELYERGKEIAEDAADLFERGKKLVQG